MTEESIIKLSSSGEISGPTIRPSSSKSESNRSLIINALSGNLGTIHNLSDARDTQTMKKLLSSDKSTLDVLDAGTTMRFLTAYLAVTVKDGVILTGSERMQERPIKILVEALNSLGASIEYERNEGYPPLIIKPFKGQSTNKLKIPSNISSQYISALLMVAPTLTEGLTINLVGEVFSRPYIKMTLALMEKFGINHRWEGNEIRIRPQPYNAGEYTIESDWSGASYWYGFTSLAKKAEITIDGVRQTSYQGDRVVANIMDELGVKSDFGNDKVIISKKAPKNELSMDFKQCPDLSLTVLVAAAANKVPMRITGLESLKIKETDRVAALQNELGKVGTRLIEHSENSWELDPSSFELEPDTVFETYDDHRMAMAFAPLSMIAPIRIKDPAVVNKSYPGFWDDINKIGVSVQ